MKKEVLEEAIFSLAKKKEVRTIYVSEEYKTLLGLDFSSFLEEGIDVEYLPQEEILGCEEWFIGYGRKVFDLFLLTKEDVVAYAEDCGYDWYEDRFQSYLIVCSSKVEEKGCLRVSQWPIGLVQAMKWLQAKDRMGTIRTKKHLAMRIRHETH